MSSALNAPKAAAKVQGVAKDQRMTFAPGARGGAQRGGAGGAPRGGGGGAPRGAPAGGAPRAAPAGGGYKGPNTVAVGGGGDKCPGCGKTVYTQEEIKACGKRWHKGCLKCQVCSLTLNLKTLLSHQNNPYCNVHVPKVGHTQVASVEMQNALKAPKAARAVKGVNKTARATFAPGALNATSGADIVNRGGEGGSDIQSKHAPKQTFVAPEPAPHVTYDNTYEDTNQSFSNLSVQDNSYDSYDQTGGDSYDDGGGYDDGNQGYDNSYDQGGDQGYDNSYDQGYEENAGGDSYDQGYDEGGYEEGGYDEGGYDEGGYDEGYYEEGYDEGYDEGYYEEGY